ncbi:MAG: tetratricopeptide repeat protein [Syntrophales bacterium]
MGRERDRKGKLFYLYFAVVVITIQLLGGCTTIKWVLVGKQELSEAKQSALRGDQTAALKKYEQILNAYPEMGDQALFRMGILYAKPTVGKSDYRKSLDAFQAILDKYPHSDFKEEAQVMVALINELRASQKQTDAWGKKSENLKQKIEQMKEIDRDEELKKRRLKPIKRGS